MKLQGIDHIGILGTGLMGLGIAQALLNLEQIQMTKQVILFTKVFFQKSIRKLRQIMKGELK
jgi:3-hydroxyacyl-CoA dehydrogenase